MKYIKNYNESILTGLTDDDISGSKFIKYEPKDNKFKIGDYVIAQDLEFVNTMCSNYLTDNVGRISYLEGQNGKNWYDVEYINVSLDLKYDIMSILQNDDVYDTYSFKEKELRFATKDEIERQSIKNDETKYNL